MGSNRVKRSLFSPLNPLKWVGFSQLVQNGKVIKRLFKRFTKSEVVASSSSVASTVSFEDCMRTYGLNEEELAKRKQAAFVTAVLYFSLSFPIVIYAIYLFTFRHLPLAGFACLILTFLLWVYAFREHFHYYQMSQRRLDCSLKEWWIALFKIKK